ncbi:MAG: glycosyltransferase family 4 protein [Acidobacteria bacterium]|nr:glycosyltransferase family 4 protein [Acidobacteriota bacterium]MBI3263707.1 glycosyltransferase family 4 protein [Acidobacteriota bacterium]
MRICHVTPHLPPDQAANALLPVHLGRWAKEAGHEVVYVAHPPVNGEPIGSSLPGPVVAVPRRSRGSAIVRKAQSLIDARRISRAASSVLEGVDVVHVHSNGLLSETCAVLAARRGKPVVMTLYGTEIWHYRPKRTIDLFTRAYRAASAVIFYSHALLARARELGLDHPRATAIYPPVAGEFRAAAEETRRRVRRDLGVNGSPLVINVKRLHPLGGHVCLVEAMATIARVVPEVRLIVCGTGSLRDELEARTRELHLERTIRFAGLVDNVVVATYDAASDVFVLPSLLEACPTVALEALACGTPVVSSDNPGGVELHGLFGDDVAVVPRENPEALAAAVIDALGARRRVSPDTTRRIEQEFRIDAVASRYLETYRQS